MLNVSSNDSDLHKVANKSRREKYTKAEEKLLDKLKFFGVFSEYESVDLKNIVNVLSIH